MVSQNQILASNALINESTAPGIAVFVGGTSGIGLETLRALVGCDTSIKIYLVGRKSSAERMHAVIEELRGVNPKAEIIWTEGDISLLADVKRICEIIKSAESRIDLLFLTAGYAPFGGRIDTSEGIDVSQSLEYYSRALFLQHLLPLLRQSEAARVVSVLGGGIERANAIKLDDMLLKKPGNFGAMNVQLQCIAMNSVLMDKLAKENPDITFIHSWPGWVSTGNIRRGHDPNSFMGWLLYLFLEPIVGFFSIRNEDSGQRHLFQCTSAAFGGRGVPWAGAEGTRDGNRVILVNYKCDQTPNTKVIQSLRNNATEKVWEHTCEVTGPFL